MGGGREGKGIPAKQSTDLLQAVCPAPPHVCPKAGGPAFRRLFWGKVFLDTDNGGLPHPKENASCFPGPLRPMDKHGHHTRSWQIHLMDPKNHKAAKKKNKKKKPLLKISTDDDNTLLNYYNVAVP